MDFLIVGTDENTRECREKFGASHEYQTVGFSDIKKHVKPNSIVFDFDPSGTRVYDSQGLIVFLNSSATTLAKLTLGIKSTASFFGFCGLPTFLNREIFEVSVLNDRSKEILEKVCGRLNTKYKIVDDRVGMVTPRIISMIINEAYFAIDENVASKEDIDLAMKLGTNYPFGPFEWSGKIGLKNIYTLLKAVYADTQDDRYQICPALEREALA